MSKNDQLDLVLQKITSRDDWESLAKVCDCESSIKVNSLSSSELCKKFNAEIRSNYGHTFANIFRNEYEPDYSKILKETAVKLKVKLVPKCELELYDVECLEKEILTIILEQVKAQIIIEKGYSAWNKIEIETKKGMEKLYAEGKITLEEMNDLKKYAGAGGMIALLTLGNLSGFMIYMIANQLFFAISRYLGLSIGVAVAGPVIGKSLALLLGPAGWALSGLWVLAGLGDTNWKKTIGAVVFVAAMRQQQKYDYIVRR